MQELNLGQIIWDLTSGRSVVKCLSYKISLTLSCLANAHEEDVKQCCIKLTRAYSEVRRKQRSILYVFVMKILLLNELDQALMEDITVNTSG